MALNERVRIARRFLRSVRIDSDLGDAATLEGFICPQSFADVLITMTRHVSEMGQGAFTWTGPYGSGKSSLVVALSALLNSSSGLQEEAAKVFGQKLAKAVWGALPMGTKGWRILPVVARRDNPVSVIGEAVTRSELISRVPRGGWTESNLIAALTGVAAEKPKSYGGLILFIDEMGKFLEAALQDGSDIYILQQLAEVASRSKGRFLIVGVLHQAFEEYAHRLSYEMRDEWAKIQGRFIDLIVNTTGEEQINLIFRAIESDHRSENGRRAGVRRRRVRSPGARWRCRRAGYHAGGMLAVASCCGVPARADITAALWSKPAQHIRLSEFIGTPRFPGFSESRGGRGAVWPRPALGVPSHQLGAVHSGFTRWTSMGLGGGSA